MEEKNGLSMTENEKNTHIKVACDEFIYDLMDDCTESAYFNSIDNIIDKYDLSVSDVKEFFCLLNNDENNIIDAQIDEDGDVEIDLNMARVNEVSWDEETTQQISAYWKVVNTVRESLFYKYNDASSTLTISNVIGEVKHSCEVSTEKQARKIYNDYTFEHAEHIIEELEKDKERKKDTSSKQVNEILDSLNEEYLVQIRFDGDDYYVYDLLKDEVFNDTQGSLSDVEKYLADYYIDQLYLEVSSGHSVNRNLENLKNLEKLKNDFSHDDAKTVYCLRPNDGIDIEPTLFYTKRVAKECFDMYVRMDVNVTLEVIKLIGDEQQSDALLYVYKDGALWYLENNDMDLKNIEKNDELEL
ncbi:MULTISPECIES: hypothetical protein [unclassified Breznakia]|uniref:hypothetical protein n=1 Tax=unclassified Breznakia TaxID=2623764 RepID=UPI0024758B95|nr:MULTISPECIES: hypothetical protein [unclassified Breznakia]MDH6367373.1 uncharacterized protein YneR [Breznakia sp. PH1-1]MDH6403905.1 uncharacterized protein YneR [Breznakia sp. PF1-11]MDH6411614.1 uncharacterized protein YneR [Breznakia sp. PFB1-11]MDH6414540.1 uncharacterized protein YneR [Breznakia sp. PFB1-14]MDH6418646.1 uncharacterized protein YneR [Breznakia sp. PFB1-12]